MTIYSDLKLEQQKILGMPKWRLGVYMVLLLFVLIYLGWSKWGSRPQSPSEGFKPMKPAVGAKKVPGPTLKIPIKKIPKEEVAKKFPNAPIRGDEDGDGQDEEEWVDSAKVPRAPNGGTVLTKIDVKTGEVTNTFEADPPPWFELERTNVIGVGYEIGTQGAKVPVYYRRYIARIKDGHILVEAGAKLALDPREKSEAHGAVLGEYNFDWP